VGSCFDRNCRVVEMRESSKILHQAIERLSKMEKADVHEKVPKRVKPAKGEVYARSEAPRGQLGYYIVADGTGVNPYRVKVKSPCFTAMSVFHVLAKGMYIADIIALIGARHRARRDRPVRADGRHLRVPRLVLLAAASWLSWLVAVIITALLAVAAMFIFLSPLIYVTLSEVSAHDRIGPNWARSACCRRWPTPSSPSRKPSSRRRWTRSCS
jgi:hypothetical protein